MVYKKFIKKDGKIYGPYAYHSRRENGEVVTEYLGKNKNNRKYFLVLASIIVFIALTFFFYRFLTGHVISTTGKATLQLDKEYKPNETIDGLLKLSLVKGEFIPVDSEIIVELGDKTYNYKLKDLTSETSKQGIFYIEDVEISGEGQGYGQEGTKENYPEVSFELEIFNEDTVVQPLPPESGADQKSQQPSQTQENVNQNNQNNSNSIATASEENNVSEQSTETSQETQTGNVETNTGASVTSETSNEITEAETSIPEIQTQAGSSETPKTPTQPESSISSEISSESSSETTSESVATGNFIRTISGLVVSADIINSIEGKTSLGNPYEFSLEERTSASIKSGSIEVNGKKIDDSFVSIAIKDGKAVVTTNYKEEEKGFGKDYLNKDEKIDLNLDLSKLDLIAEDAVIRIKLVYNNVEVVNTASNIKISESIESEIENITEGNISRILNATNITSKIDFLEIINLSNEEREILKDETGSDIVKTSKAEVSNGRLIVRYEIGKYWREYSYDYNNEISDRLNKIIEFERNYWLKSLAQQLSKESGKESKEISSLLRDFNLGLDNVQSIQNESINQSSNQENNESI